MRRSGRATWSGSTATRTADGQSLQSRLSRPRADQLHQPRSTASAAAGSSRSTRGSRPASPGPTTPAERFPNNSRFPGDTGFAPTGSLSRPRGLLQAQLRPHLDSPAITSVSTRRRHGQSATILSQTGRSLAASRPQDQPELSRCRSRTTPNEPVRQKWIREAYQLPQGDPAPQGHRHPAGAGPAQPVPDQRDRLPRPGRAR